MRALLFAVALSSVAGCSSTDERTLGLASVDSDDTAFWLDGSGIDPIAGAGVDSPRPLSCRTHDDCTGDGFCTKRADEVVGLCLAACVGPPESSIPLRGCRRGLERCLYFPKTRLGVCVQPCTQDSECTLGLRCQVFSKRRPDLGRVCVPTASD